MANQELLSTEKRLRRNFYPKNCIKRLHRCYRRHFALGLAHWTSVDLNWPGQPAYQYAGSSPIERADPSGLSTCQVNYFGMSAAKAQCSGSIKGGVLWLKAYKTVYFECAAQCSGGMSSCFLDQQYSLVETLAVVGQLPVVRYDTGGFVQDGPVQYPYPYSSMQGNWQAQSWTLIGMDSPGYWAYQNPEASPCNVGPQTPYNSGIPSDQNKMSFLWFTGHFETVCQCDQLVMPDDNLKSKLYWHFTFSVAWIGTDVSNVITLGGDCA
jgi:hypothetical protein